MKTFYDTLRELVAWEPTAGAQVLSLYLDVSAAHVEHAFAFAESECEALLERLEGGAADAVRALVTGRLAGAIEEARRNEYDGLAIFLSHDPPLDEMLSLRLPFHNQADVARGPLLAQLLFFAEEYEQSIAVTLLPGAIHVTEIHVGDARESHALRPSHGRSLGEELGAYLHRHLHEAPQLHVILLGAPEERRAVEAALDQPVRDRIIDRVERPLLPTDPDFLIAVHRSLQAYERRAEAAGVAGILERREKNEPVAIGLAETLAAINHGTLATLYILQSLTQKGWLCDVCTFMGALPAPPACLSCGASVSVVPLEEHILDQAAACGAEIDTVFESSELGLLGGVAGTLHPHPREES